MLKIYTWRNAYANFIRLSPRSAANPAEINETTIEHAIRVVYYYSFGPTFHSERTIARGIYAATIAGCFMRYLQTDSKVHARGNWIIDNRPWLFRAIVDLHNVLVCFQMHTTHSTYTLLFELWTSTMGVFMYAYVYMYKDDILYV